VEKKDRLEVQFDGENHATAWDAHCLTTEQTMRRSL
jgi:hypothetical protein